MKKQLGKLIFFRFLVGKLKLVLVLVFLFILSTSLQFSFDDVNASSLNYNYTEDFTTTALKNVLQTTANWLGTGFVDLSKSFVQANGTKGYIDNVSGDQENSIYPLIFLDNKNQPYVAWESTPAGLNSEIYFTKGNLMTLNWEQMNGTAGRDNVSHTRGVSNIDRVAVASDGNPFIVWQDNTLPGPDGIYGNGDDVQGTANDYSILFSQWNKSTNTWSKMDGSAGIEKISNNAVGSPSRLPRIVLDKLDRPFVVWDQQVSPTNNEIYFTRWDGMKWAKMDGLAGIENLSNSLGESSFPRILLDANNRPQVMWMDATPGNNDIFFSKWAFNAGVGVCGAGIVSCWTNMAGNTLGSENISNDAGDSNYDRQYDANFVLGNNNFPYISWRDNTGSAFYTVYFSHWNGTAWSSMDGLSNADILNTGANSNRPQIVVDSSNNPQIAWISSVAPNKLYFSHWNSGASQWQWLDGTPGIQIIDATSSSFPTMAIDNTNNLFISWLRSNPKNVAAVRSNGPNWTKLDGTVGFSDVSGTTPWANNRPQMVLAPNGNIFFTWETGTSTINPEIWATYWDNDLQTLRIIREGKEQLSGIVGGNHWAASNIKIDHNFANQPFINWSDACLAGSSSLEVCLTHWDGLNWVKMDGTSGTDQLSNFSGSASNVHSILRFDSTGTKPYLAWSAYEVGPVYKLYFSRWDGANFVAMNGTPGFENIAGSTLSRLSGSSSESFFSLDLADNPYVINTGNPVPGVNDEIYFAKWTSSPVTCAPALSCWTNMAGDTTGFENISNDAPESSMPVLNLGTTTNTPYVLWRSQNPGSTYDVFFTKWTIGATPAVCGPLINDCWTNMAGTVAGPEKINTLSINNVGGSFVLDNVENPYIIWRENGLHLTRWGGANGWTGMDGIGDGNPLTIDSDLISSSLAAYPGEIKFDSLNNPGVAFTNDLPNRQIMFTHWAGSQWTTMAGTAGVENISNTSGHAQMPKLFIDSTDNPAIFWADDTDTSYLDDYFFKHWNGSAWVNMTGENNFTNISRNLGGMNTNVFDVTKDSNDEFYVAFNRQEPGTVNLYFSRTGIPVNYYRTAQALDVSGGLGNVIQATLGSVADNNGGPVTIKYFFSNDGGYIWQPATVGVPINFASNTSLEWRARMKTTNTLVIPTITGLSIDYVTSAGVTNFGGNPATPSDLSCMAQSNSVIRWNFTDNANNETGFKLRDSNGVILETNTADLAYLDESNLQTNTQYRDRQVTAFNNGGESDVSNKASCYTLANIPAKIEVHSVGKDYVDLDIEATDNNPTYTVYAIRENTSAKYVQADGTFGDTAVWQTEAGWGGETGIKVIGATANTNTNVNAQLIISLAENTGYSFSVKAKNGDGIETALSTPTDVTTGQTPITSPLIVATKGVAINLVKNENYLVNNLIKVVHAQGGVGFPASGESQLILVARSFGIFLGLALVILIILLISGLLAATQHLAKGASLGAKLKLAWHILSQEPAKVFSAYAAKAANGTYGHGYEKHRSLHLFAQNNFKRLIGLAVIDLMILSYVAISLNHSGIAQTVPYDQSGQEVKVGDKLSYIIELENQGAGAGTNVMVTDILNNQLNYLGGSAKIKRNNQEIISGIIINGNNLSFSLGTVARNEIVDMLFTAQIKAGSEDQTITNIGQVYGDNFISLSTNTTNNRVEKKAVVPPPPPPPPGNINLPPLPPLPPSNINVPPVVSPPPGENINVPPVVPPGGITQPPSGPSPVSGNETVQAVVRFLTSPEIKKTSQNIVTPILLTLAVLNTLPTVIILTSYLLPYLNLLFVEPLLLFFRKKRQKWGIVYDSLSKMPIGLALVRLYSKEDHRLIQTKVTDKEGRYIMIVNEPGSYYLSITKPGYEYPSRYLRDEKQDAKYIDLYHGEALEVKEQGVVVTANIPLDPVDKKAVSASEAVRSYLLTNLRLIISYLGIILALIVVLIYPTAITIGSLILHVIMFVMFRRLIIPPKPKSWGIVYDETNKQPLHYALVRILDTKFNKLLETQVTDSRGRYSFLVGKNEYQLLAEKQGYQPREIKPVDLVNKATIVDLDVALKKSTLKK